LRRAGIWVRLVRAKAIGHLLAFHIRQRDSDSIRSDKRH
jgi:hypothetical protein